MIEKKFLVFSELPDGCIDRYQCFAVSEEEAEAKIKEMVPNSISVKAFDWYIQFKFI